MKLEKFIGHDSYAKLNPYDKLYLSAGAVKQYNLAESDYVELYYSESKEIVGIKPVEKETPQTLSLHFVSNGAAKSVSLMSFLRHYDLNWEHGDEFSVEWNNNHQMLILNNGGSNE